MITLKSAHEIELMRRAGKITAAARALAGEMVKPGVTTHEIDKAVYRFIKSQGAEPSFLNYSGYPASVCVSVNDEIIHGIPGPRVLKEGDIVSVDVGAYIGGFHGDCAATYPCGKISAEAQRLIDVTQQSFFEGIRFAREGQRLSDISAAVQKYVEDNGYSVVREYVGHGIGRKMHESPEVPNFGAPGHGPRLLRGMTIAVEPMVNAGGAAVRVMPDGWTVKTQDGSLAAHYENTILITNGEAELLTLPRSEDVRMDIARATCLATAGREKGRLFFVWMYRTNIFCSRTAGPDGSKRPSARSAGTLQRAGAAPEELAAKLRSSEIITNSELRKALAVYRGEHGNQDQEGSTLGKIRHDRSGRHCR